MKTLLVGLTAAFALTGAAHAAQIGVIDFTAPTVQGFGAPGPGEFVDINEPKTIGAFTFTTSTGGGLRWFSANQGFQDCIGGCITNRSSTNDLILTLDASYDLAGIFIGQATAYNLQVSFFDAASSLLGTVNVSGPGDGTSFAGWRDDAVGVRSITVHNPTPNNFFLAAQSGYLQANGAIPEPGTWALMILGFSAAGVAMRRRRLTAAA